MTHGFWRGRASSSSCLPCWPALRGFFPPPKESPWVLWAFDACCIWNRTHLLPVFTATSVLNVTQQEDEPKVQSQHLEATVPQRGTSPAHPSHCKITEDLLSWNRCCLPELDPLVLRGCCYSLMNCSETQNTTLRFLVFLYCLLEAVLVVSLVSPSKKQLFSQSLKI